MRVKAHALLIGATCLAVSAIAKADATTQGFYVGGGYSEVTYSENSFPDADLGALFVRGGYQLNQNVALEARLGTGVQDDSIHVYGINVDVEMEDFYGFYAKAGLPTQVGFYPYVMLGATHAKVKAKAGGYSASDDSSDLSYGLGVDYWFDPAISAGLEWAKFYDKDGVEISGVTLGLNVKF